MKCLSVLIVVFLFGAVSLFARAPDTAWTKTYGGDGWDYGKTVQQTSDGGYIITGIFFNIRTNEVLSKSLSGPPPNDNDVYLIKTDSLGNVLWIRNYGSTNEETGASVQQTTDGGYIVAGNIGSHTVYLIRTNSLGDTLWTRTYGGDDFDQGYSVQQTTDGGYIVAGYTRSYGAGKDDVYLIKTDSIGDTLWTRAYGGIEDDRGGYGQSVQQTTDGGYIVAGWTSSYGAGEDDVYLIKTDSDGDTLWTRTYGGNDWDEGYSVQQTTDGGYIVVGRLNLTVYGNDDVYLIKTDSDGDTLWTRTYGGTDRDAGYSVQQTSDEGYIVAGWTDSYGAGEDDVYLIKTDSIGDTLWTRTCGGTDDDYGWSVQQTSDGGYIVAGYTFSYGLGLIDVYLIKLKPDREEITTDSLSLPLAGPNPFTDETTIKYEITEEADISLSLYSVLGQEVKKLYSGKKSSGIHSVTWDGSGNSGKLPAGIYFLKIKTGKKEASLKLTFIR